MDLDGVVDDGAHPFGDQRLHGADPDPGLGVAHRVHRLRGAQHHQPQRLDLDAAPRDDLRVLAQAGQLLAERLAVEPAPDHEVERTLGRADRSHAVVDAAGAEAYLRDLEAASLPEQDVLLRHAHVGEAQVHVAVRRVVLAEHVHGTEDLDAGRVHRHEDLRLAVVGRCLGARHHHDDHDLAARIAGAGDVVLLAVDHPLVAVELGAARDVRRVRRRDVGFGHRVRRADLSGEQRLQPRAFCSAVPTCSSTSMFPVSGAEQLKTSDAIGFLPSSDAMYA